MPLVNEEHGCQNKVQGEVDKQEEKALKKEDLDPCKIAFLSVEGSFICKLISGLRDEGGVSITSWQVWKLS